MSIFVSTSYSSETHEEWCGNYVILHNANVFFFVFFFFFFFFFVLFFFFFSLLKRPSENTESLENLSQGYKIYYVL